MAKPVARAWPGKGLLRRLVSDRRGVGAIEFAIVVPVLVMTYIGAFEITMGVTASRKISRASANVSDLLTRNDTTNKATLDAMKEVTKSVVAPFSQGRYSLKITGIAVNDAGKATVAWSRGWARDTAAGAEVVSTPYKKGDSITLPQENAAKGSFLVRTEFSMAHPILLMAPSLSPDYREITLGKTSYFRQRKGNEITCSDC